mgnify:FL=1
MPAGPAAISAGGHRPAGSGHARDFFYAMTPTPVHRAASSAVATNHLVARLLVAVWAVLAGQSGAASGEIGSGGDSPPALCRRIDAALAHACDGRLLDARVNGAWQVVHGILAFGPELPLSTADGRAAAQIGRAHV